MPDGDRRIVEARQSFSMNLRGAPYAVGAGDRFWSDDPIVKGRECLFRELVVRDSRPPRRPTTSAVETATAEPGSTRKVTRPRGGSKQDEPKDIPDA